MDIKMGNYPLLDFILMKLVGVIMPLDFIIFLIIDNPIYINTIWQFSNP